MKGLGILGRPAIGAVFPIVLGLCGCMVGPDYEPPKTEAPAAWTEGQIAGVDIGVVGGERLDHWWHEFKDPVLDQLVDRALQQNLDLKMATQRIVEARADRDAAEAGFYPTIAASTQDGRLRYSTTVHDAFRRGTQNYYRGVVDVSWEIDVFGGNRRAVEAAEANLGGSEESRRAVLVSLLGELGSNYAILRSTQEQLLIAERSFVAQEQAAELAKRLRARGLASELAVAEAVGQVETVRATIPPMRAAIAQTSHAIAVLLGARPGELEAMLTKPAPAMPAPPTLPIAMPSEVLRNRPDIREAERGLAAANASIGVATAQLFPHFSFNPYAGLETGSITRLLSKGSLIWGLVGQASVPIFDAGKLSSQITKAKAVTEQNRLAYEETVLQAFQEVEDALVAYGQERSRLAALDAAVTADRIAVDRATRLYKEGLTEFLTLLDAERTLYVAELAQAQSRLAQVQATITLFKALGGGWQQTYPPDRPAEVAQQ